MGPLLKEDMGLRVLFFFKDGSYYSVFDADVTNIEGGN